MENQNIHETNEITARPDYGAEIAVIIRSNDSPTSMTSWQLSHITDSAGFCC